MCLINISLGNIAFNNLSFKNNQEVAYSETYVPKFHPTIFEAISAAFLYASKHIDLSKYDFSELKEKHIKLLNNEEFKDSISNRTTNLENIKKRCIFRMKNGPKWSIIIIEFWTTKLHNLTINYIKIS